MILEIEITINSFVRCLLLAALMFLFQADIYGQFVMSAT